MSGREDRELRDRELTGSGGIVGVGIGAVPLSPSAYPYPPRNRTDTSPWDEPARCSWMGLTNPGGG